MHSQSSTKAWVCTAHNKVPDKAKIGNWQNGGVGWWCCRKVPPSLSWSWAVKSDDCNSGRTLSRGIAVNQAILRIEIPRQAGSHFYFQSSFCVLFIHCFIFDWLWLGDVWPGGKLDVRGRIGVPVCFLLWLCVMRSVLQCYHQPGALIVWTNNTCEQLCRHRTRCCYTALQTTNYTLQILSCLGRNICHQEVPKYSMQCCLLS